MNVAERAWYLPAGFPLCLWPSIAVQMPEPPQQVEEKGGGGKTELALKYTKGKMTWGTFFRSTATVSLPTGGTSGRSRRGRQRPDGGKFYKNICSIWMVQIFSKTWAQPKLIFHKTFANIYGFSFLFPCGHGSKRRGKMWPHVCF